MRRRCTYPQRPMPTLLLEGSLKEEGSGMLAVGWGAAWLSFPHIYQHPATAFGWAPLGGDVYRARNPHVADPPSRGYRFTASAHHLPSTCDVSSLPQHIPFYG